MRAAPPPRAAMFNACAHAFADIAELESTDDRRSKRADIILSGAHRGASYKVSAFTKIEGEQPLFYDLLRAVLLVYHFAKYALLSYRLYSLNCYTFISPIVSAISIDDRGRSSLFVSHVTAYIISPFGSVHLASMNSRRGRNFMDLRCISIFARIVGVIYFTSFAITHFTVPSGLDFARRRLHLIKTHSSGAYFRGRIGINKSYTVTRTQTAAILHGCT